MEQNEILAFLAQCAAEDPKPSPEEIMKRLEIRAFEKSRARITKKHNDAAHDAYVAWIQAPPDPD